jgi:hypothetical protein
MAYSYPTYTPFSRLGRVGARLQSTTTPFQSMFYNQNPDIGYQRFLDQFQFGTSQQQTMQSLYDQVFRQWTANQAQGFGRTKPINWLHQLARLSPQQRHEDPTAFMRPARVISFL